MHLGALQAVVAALLEGRCDLGEWVSEGGGGLGGGLGSDWVGLTGIGALPALRHSLQI